MTMLVGNSQNQAVVQEFDNNWVYDPANPDRVITLVKNIHNL